MEHKPWEARDLLETQVRAGPLRPAFVDDLRAPSMPPTENTWVRPKHQETLRLNPTSHAAAGLSPSCA